MEQDSTSEQPLNRAERNRIIAAGERHKRQRDALIQLASASGTPVPDIAEAVNLPPQEIADALVAQDGNGHDLNVVAIRRTRTPLDSPARVAGVDIDAVIDVLLELEPGAKVQYIDGKFAVEVPTLRHQGAIVGLANQVESPDGLSWLLGVYVSDGEHWIVPDLLLIPQSMATSAEPNPLDPSDVRVMVEILSPISELADRGSKRKFAEKHNIDYWIVQLGERDIIEVMPYGGGIVDPPRIAPESGGEPNR